ncbi:LVIVD repeat-containing protein [Mucilaginibacter sp. AW1-3]
MKTNATTPRLITLILALPLLILAACKHDTSTSRTFHMTISYPISITNARNSVSVSQTGRSISAPGKIYVYGNYLFITEVNKGIHVVDNTNPVFPHFINFINIPGNADIAINNNILYADNYVDLLAFDITNPAHITKVKQLNDTFDAYYYDKAKGTIIGYKDTVVTDYPLYLTSGVYSASGSSASQSQSYGTGGSTARFTLMNSYLYTINQNNLKLFDVSQPANPGYVNSISIGSSIQTIFPYQNKLFLGGSTGMQIFDASVPSAPVKLSTYTHFTSCDPVVVQGKYAYVTLSTGHTCHVGANELDVVNIEDAAHPVLVSSFPMINPHGLAVADTRLFVCEGASGLKAFNNSDPLNVGKNQLSFLTGVNSQDVIAGPKSLIITGSNGIYQYDYTNASNLKIISRISILTPH